MDADAHNMEVHQMDQKVETMQKAPVVLPEGKCCALYCGECSYFNGSKVSFGKCWCGYYQAYSRKASDLACRNFER